MSNSTKRAAISVFALFLALAWTSDSKAATVITLGDFTSPVVLDFESLAPGPISTTDPFFTGVGISSVTVANGTPGDSLNINTDGQALGSVGGVLSVIAVGGALDNGTSAGNPTFVITFAGNQLLFGYSLIDQTGNFPVTFLLNNVVVDSFVHSTVTAAPIYLQAASPFNMVQISQEACCLGGIALDNITFEAAVAAPEPSVLLLLGAGLAGLALVRRKRS